jgi:hypothetical protein
LAAFCGGFLHPGFHSGEGLGHHLPMGRILLLAQMTGATLSSFDPCDGLSDQVENEAVGDRGLLAQALEDGQARDGDREPTLSRLLRQLGELSDPVESGS